MKLAKRLEKLGTETAFAVSASAANWAALGNKVYPFHLGDLNISTPQSIIDATIKAIRDGHTGYCPGPGIPKLRAAIACDVGTKRQMTFSAEEVSIQPGGKPVIGKFIAAVMDPGDQVLYPNPGYPIYESQIEYQGGHAIPYSYVETASGFELDLDAIKASLSSKTKAIIYNNYQNPNGAQSSTKEMEALAELAIANDLWVLSDEAYYEIQYSGEPMTIANLPGMRERTIILYTCSKRFAMTGWRLGAAIGPKAVIDIISKFNTNYESCTTHFIQQGMVEAISAETAGPAAIIEKLRRRRDAAVAGLNAIAGISITAPESTFYLFPNVNRVMALKGYDDVNQLMDEALVTTGVSFCTRKHFGRPKASEKNHYIRLAYSGIEEDDIKGGLAKLKTYFEAG